MAYVDNAVETTKGNPTLGKKVWYFIQIGRAHV